MAGPLPQKCCCRSGAPVSDVPWISGSISTSVGPIARVSTRLGLADHLGSWAMRWAMGRMEYRIEPGLYAAGSPSSESPVLVSANYKMSFDRLRRAIDGLDAWILVLDTRGINVWCAAAKGTFGSDELIRRLESVRLPEIVSHRELIVPQLGAAGVAAHEVRKRSGFRVVYGPVRAGDIPRFLADGKKASPLMRSVQFGFWDRVVLAPIEFVLSAKWVILTALCFFLLGGLGRDGYSLARLWTTGGAAAMLLLGVYLGAVVLTAALLPWLPGRAFSLKGAWLGLAFLVSAAALARGSPGLLDGPLGLAAWALLIPAGTSFLAMNFTGATNFTSLSGVRREMRVAVPLQALAAVAGVALWLIARFT